MMYSAGHYEGTGFHIALHLGSAISMQTCYLYRDALHRLRLCAIDKQVGLSLLLQQTGCRHTYGRCLNT